MASHTHIHTLTSTPYCKCHLYFCLCQAFSLTKHTHRHTATEGKRLVLLPNKLMCHGFLSDISEKKKKFRKEAAAPLFFFLFFSSCHGVETKLWLWQLFFFCKDLQLLWWETLPLWRAMSRCCVVKVITLTEIQLLQVGEMTYLQPRNFEAMTHTEENIVLNSMCAFVCTQDTFAVTARLTMEAPWNGTFAISSLSQSYLSSHCTI